MPRRMLHFNDRERFRAGKTVLEYYRHLYMLLSKMNLDTEKFWNEERAYETYDGPPERKDEESSDAESGECSTSNSSDGYDTESSWTSLFGSSYTSDSSSTSSASSSSSTSTSETSR